MKAQGLKSYARRHPDQLQIIRVSERRCGIRRSVLERFLESHKSALTGGNGKLTPALAKAVAAKRAEQDEVANG